MNFTFQQKLTIALGLIGAATSAFGALNSIMTPTQALIGTVVLGFASASLGVIGTVVSSSQNLKDTVGKMPSTTVVTDKASSEALPNNPDVIAATPELISAIKKAS